jgi:hypothetical protein
LYLKEEVYNQVAKKLQLNPGEMILLEANAPSVTKIVGLLPGATKGRGILTNQRLVHFKKPTGYDAVTDLMLKLAWESTNFEISLSAIQTLERTLVQVNPSIIITTTDNKQYKFVDYRLAEYGSLDFEQWMSALVNALAQYSGKPITQQTQTKWVVGSS